MTRELSSTLRDVRDALDRLDEAIQNENSLISASKDSIGDSKAKEEHFQELIQADLAKCTAVQQHKEDVLAMLDVSMRLRGPDQSEKITKEAIDGVRRALVQETQIFLKECFEFGVQFSKTGFANKEAHVLQTQTKLNYNRQQLEKRREALIQRESNLDHQLHQWQEVYVQTLNENKSLHESIKNFNSLLGTQPPLNESKHKTQDAQTIQLRQQLDGVQSEISSLKLELANRKLELQRLLDERSRVEQLMRNSKSKSNICKTQEKKRKQSSHSQEANKRPKNDVEFDEASIDCDLFGGIRHDRF
eukprot:g6022.t1